MNVKTARIISFILSISGLIIAVYYLVSDAKEVNKKFYWGLVLLLGSNLFRRLIKYKPEWFKEIPTTDEKNSKELGIKN